MEVSATADDDESVSDEEDVDDEDPTNPRYESNYTVEKMIAFESFEYKGQRQEYVYIKWDNYPESENTWEPVENIAGNEVKLFVRDWKAGLLKDKFEQELKKTRKLDPRNNKDLESLERDRKKTLDKSLKRKLQTSNLAADGHNDGVSDNGEERNEIEPEVIDVPDEFRAQFTRPSDAAPATALTESEKLDTYVAEYGFDALHRPVMTVVDVYTSSDGGLHAKFAEDYRSFLVTDEMRVLYAAEISRFFLERATIGLPITVEDS